MQQLCGIDEAGRGCWAGDLVLVGLVLKRPIEGLNDSKKLSEKQRFALEETIKKNSIYHLVGFTSSDVDKLGLSFCLKSGLEQIIDFMKSTLDDVEFLYDGNNHFGTGIPTLVKADATVAEVSAASILAKCERDRRIENLQGYEKYNFPKNKGYGTKDHLEAIKKFGRSDQHRHSYKIKALEEAPKIDIF